MKNNFIDDIVKKSLEGLDVPYDAASWQGLEQRILDDANLSDLSTNPEHAFDTAIKSALVTDNISAVPMNWEALETQMDLDPELIPDSVDQPIKTALENIEVAYTPAAWDLMEAQLDLEDNMAELDADNTVDQIVYNKINNIDPTYDAASWRTLSDKLDGIGILRQRLVYRYKAAELLLFVLLLFTIYNFLPLGNTTILPDTPIAHQTSSNTNTTSDGIEEISATASEITPLFADATSPSNLDKKQESSEKVENAASLTPSEEQIIEQKEVLSLMELNSANRTNLRTVDIKNTIRTASQNRKLVSRSFPVISTEKETSNSLRYKLLTEAQKLEMGLALLPVIQTSLFDFENTKPQYNCITCTTPKTMRIYASMFLMGDFNYILTPYDRTFQVEAYSNSSAGYGLGSTLAFSYGKWELETGAMYATKNYQPETLTETIGDFEAGYVDLSLNGIELSILQIPLHIRYNFDKSTNWNIYASAGASLQVAVFKNSDFNSDFTARPSLGESNSRQTIQEIINESSTFNEQRFSNGGWFEEGGSFNENRYFTANVGLGIERSLGSRWSVFTQTLYQHTLLSNGFGPNNDRINTVSLLVGARTQFGSKINSKH